VVRYGTPTSRLVEMQTHDYMSEPHIAAEGVSAG